MLTTAARTCSAQRPATGAAATATAVVTVSAPGSLAQVPAGRVPHPPARVMPRADQQDLTHPWRVCTAVTGVATDRDIHRLCDPRSGVVVLDIRPDDTGTHARHEDLLVALGHTPAVALPGYPNRKMSSTLLGQWWRATGVRHLVIHHAHWLDAASASWLDDIAKSAATAAPDLTEPDQVTVWLLLGPTAPPDLLEFLVRRGQVTVSLAELQGPGTGGGTRVADAGRQAPGGAAEGHASVGPGAARRPTSAARHPALSDVDALWVPSLLLEGAPEEAALAQQALAHGADVASRYVLPVLQAGVATRTSLAILDGPAASNTVAQALAWHIATLEFPQLAFAAWAGMCLELRRHGFWADASVGQPATLLASTAGGQALARAHANLEWVLGAEHRPLPAAGAALIGSGLSETAISHLTLGDVQAGLAGQAPTPGAAELAAALAALPAQVRWSARRALGAAVLARQEQQWPSTCRLLGSGREDDGARAALHAAREAGGRHGRALGGHAVLGCRATGAAHNCVRWLRVSVAAPLPGRDTLIRTGLNPITLSHAALGQAAHRTPANGGGRSGPSAARSTTGDIVRRHSQAEMQTLLDAAASPLPCNAGGAPVYGRSRLAVRRLLASGDLVEGPAGLAPPAALVSRLVMGLPEHPVAPAQRSLDAPQRTIRLR